MKYNVKEITQVASKYLDRVEIKGLQEFQEFSFLINFLADVERGEVLITEKDDN